MSIGVLPALGTAGVGAIFLVFAIIGVHKKRHHRWTSISAVMSGVCFAPPVADLLARQILPRLPAAAWVSAVAGVTYIGLLYVFAHELRGHGHHLYRTPVLGWLSGALVFPGVIGVRALFEQVRTSLVGSAAVLGLACAVVAAVGIWKQTLPRLTAITAGVAGFSVSPWLLKYIAGVTTWNWGGVGVVAIVFAGLAYYFAHDFYELTQDARNGVPLPENDPHRWRTPAVGFMVGALLIAGGTGLVSAVHQGGHVVRNTGKVVTTEVSGKR